jgi:hypothetical protein
MTKDRIAKAATLLVLMLLLGLAVARRWQRGTAQPKAPEDTIYEMLDAARAGDVKRYLAQFSGQMEAHLRQTAAEKSEGDFRNYLKSSNEEIKGVAITPAKSVSDGQVEIRVEYVYQDRNEVQMMYLEKVSDQWKIARVDSAERIKTLIPYGTPVS